MNRVKNCVFLVRKWSYTTFNIVNIRKMWEKKGKIRRTRSMTKKRSSEIFTLKMDIFPEIGPRKNFLVPPKFGARSPPMEGEERHLSKNFFKRELRNGECVQRIRRLLYSPSQGCLYCFSCCLLSKKQSAFATSGFNCWKYSNLTADHENEVEHLICMTAYLVRHKEAACVDSLGLLSFAFLPHEVCHFVERIKLLVSEKWKLLGILELLSEFDPFGGGRPILPS